MKTQGWIVYNGNLPGDKFLDYAEMLQAAALRLSSRAHVVKNNELLSILSNTELGINSRRALPDYVVFTDKDIYLAKQLEYLGVPVFNSAEAIAVSDDKIATYQELARLHLPIPKTIIAPKIFTEGTLSATMYDQVIENLGLPLIVKEAFGSFGEQVYLIHDKDELIHTVEGIGNRPFVFQKFIESSFGVDIRLQVVGDNVVAGMKRMSNNDFRANITAGGTMEPYEATDEEKNTAVAGTKAIGADFAGVDLLFGESGPIICEVNSNAHIRNLFECTGINAADYIMSYVLDKVNKGE